MTITKEKKNQLLAKYKGDLSSATNAVIVKQSGIPVTLANKIRMELKVADGNMNIIKKRIFLKALKDAGLEEIGVDTLEGSVFALYATENEFGPLKVINKYLKEFKKANKGSEFTFLGGWFEKKWQGGEYVDELANIPTKEELLSKLCYLFSYPLQSFACALNEVAKKNGGAVEIKAESKEEVKVEVTTEETKEVIASESEAIQEEKIEETPSV
ncbi:MAG TPA: 50S ribosomal protein L10 [Candidatus Absconditabacterales bacterium]|nr:50S ribosomal protein L10 [Candidatus Absconditabacterales bacterium]